ncbi:hypothetical protein EYF80_050911 [Liparis tanakae]|uniref:Uncharacterized protein n=1 Tax=Liparis tanakae TaxID=230148 RepID=A0A4Z2FES7_9TELE|nr:hypothetical protein EYF80_050911 [Liparis tanakae]
MMMCPTSSSGDNSREQLETRQQVHLVYRLIHNKHHSHMSPSSGQEQHPVSPGDPVPAPPAGDGALSLKTKTSGTERLVSVHSRVLLQPGGGVGFLSL